MEEKDPWELEEEVPEQPRKLEFKPKAHLVLEGSDEHEWGVVKDCHGNINFIPDDAEIVGTWNKYSLKPSGGLTYWVSLQTPLSALEDRATQLYAELAESREKSMQRLGLRSSPKKTPRSEHKVVKEEQSGYNIFDKLRQKLGG